LPVDEHRDGARMQTPPPPPAERKQQVGDGITFSVNINIAMSEMQGWHPQRIAAFFEGLAKVVSAKEGSKEESSDK